MGVIIECVLAKEQISVTKNTSKKEGEEIVFCVVVVQQQESNREMHSVFFATRPVPEEPAFRAFLSHNPRVVTGHR